MIKNWLITVLSDPRPQFLEQSGAGETCAFQKSSAPIKRPLKPLVNHVNVILSGWKRGTALDLTSMLQRYKPIGRTITKIPPHACTNLEFIFLIHLYLLRVYKMVRYKWYRTYSIFVMVYFKCVFIEIVYNIMCNIVVHRYISVFNRNMEKMLFENQYYIFPSENIIYIFFGREFFFFKFLSPLVSEI